MRRYLLLDVVHKTTFKTEMSVLFGLLFLLLGGTSGFPGAVTKCDATQDGAQCYGALGGSVHLQLRRDDGDNSGYVRFIKYPGGAHSVFLADGYHPTQDRYALVNGALVLSNLTKNDSADYQIFTFRITKKEGHMVHLTIEAPVSSPQLSSQCLPTGEMRLSCSSEGDSVQYSWTQGGQLLSVDSDSLTVPGGLLVSVSCTVGNHVSGGRVARDILPCPDSQWMRPFYMLWAMEMLALGAVCLLFLYLHRRTLHSQSSGRNSHTT